jgi:hypothetical protein
LFILRVDIATCMSPLLSYMFHASSIDYVVCKLSFATHNRVKICNGFY